MILKIFGSRQAGFYSSILDQGWAGAQLRPFSAFVYHDSRQREENQILPLGHFEWFRYKSPTSVRLSS